MLSTLRQRLTIPLLHLRRRNISTSPQQPKLPPRTGSDEPIFPEGTFEKQASFFFDLSRRFIKFSAIGTCALAVTAYALFEGTQLWVEYVEFAPEHNQDTLRWEWGMDPENWGPTDPGLGYKGRHSLRAAWMAQNWGSGRPASVIDETISQPGGLNVVNSDLARAHQFLNTAISIAEQRNVAGKLQPQTIATLFALHASILERVNDPLQATRYYARAWASSSGNGLFATYVAARLGDLNRRLGQSSDALAWWARAIHLAQGSAGPGPLTETPGIPRTIPSSPFQQRVLASIMVSLSAFYATSGRLKDAQDFEEASLRWLRTASHLDPLSTATPPQRLHLLFLLHRSSLVSVHLAEVLHARKHSPSSSLELLRTAAESSERVSRSLLDPISDVTSPRVIPSDVELSNDYIALKALRRPAISLLRDARHTAVEAWNLMGILSEPTDPQAALACYERGLLCAGITPHDSHRDSVESEWKTVHSNYIRLREQIRKV